MTSSRSSTSPGLLVAAAGAALALGSLWLPWYLIRIPEAFRELFKGIGGAAQQGAPQGSTPADQLGQAFTGLFQGLAAAIPEEISGSGWQVMETGDVVLAIAAGVGLLVAIAMSGALSSVRVDGQVAGRIVGLLGVLVVAVAAYHVVVRPGGDFPGLEASISLRYGIFVALLGGLMMIGGGLVGGGAAATLRADAPATVPGMLAPVGAQPHGTPAQPLHGAAGRQPLAAAPFGGAPEQPGPELPSGWNPGASVAPPGWAPPHSG